jgi:glutamine amidotransferase
MIGILDYGMGNIGSVSYALERIGAKSAVVTDAQEIGKCDGLIIPGVGAFAPAMKRLEQLKPSLKEFVASGRPMLGICLGMEVLFDEGTEGGKCAGLGFLEGSVKKLEGAPKLPQVGWNTIEITGESPLFAGVASGEYAYFVHSYACKPKKAGVTIATTEYGERFACAVGGGNVFGVQFHPEKSGAAGERLLRNFARMT